MSGLVGISRVAVLLSSYNGERYIQEQIDSILRQQDVEVTLYVRDDGSSDSTVEILKRFAAEYPNVILNLSSNIGLIRSFFELLSGVPDGFDYYAFADQDDVWLPCKLAAGSQALKGIKQELPKMYCCRTEYVNSSLAHLSYSPLYQSKKIGLGNALVQNVATGCTVIINPEARNLILTELPEKCIVHDWWIYLVVSAFGSVTYDPVSYIKYRQHESNVIGGSSSFVKNFIKRTRRFLSPLREDRTSSQIAVFHRIFKSRLTPQQINVVEKMLIADDGILARIALIGKGFYWRHSFVDNILLRIVILFGRF
jgi:glycosyltransferase involved in cell wall biosynthesis